MENMYYRNRNLKELESRIKSSIETSEGIGYVFEDTVFFPGGGGQISDSGYVEIEDGEGKSRKVNIRKVLEEGENNVVHILDAEEKIDNGTKIKEVLDWTRREDAMHQHTGQHVLSGCIFSLFKRNTKGLHIGKDMSQLDIEGEFSDEMVAQIEDYANKVISDAIEIKNYILTDESKKSVVTRRPLPENAEDIRILEIPGLDINACCGVHCTNTRDLKMIKIKKFYKHKDGTRFEYLAGDRAIDYVLMRDRVFTRVLNRFNCNEENIESAIDNLEAKKDEFYEENRFLMEKHIESLYRELESSAEENSDGIAVLKKCFKGEKDKVIKELAKKISDSENSLVIFGNEGEASNSILLQCSKKLAKKYEYIDNGKVIGKFREEYAIKGGGSVFMAQGMCPKEKNIDNLLDSIYHIYIEK